MENQLQSLDSGVLESSVIKVRSGAKRFFVVVSKRTEGRPSLGRGTGRGTEALLIIGLY